MKKYIQQILLVSACYAAASTGCYYDKEEWLYPNTSCDTTAITYSTKVLPIITSSCYSCHAGNTPSGGVRLDSYNALNTYVQNGKFWGAVSHASGYSPMPKNASKLSDCQLTIIRKWLDDGAPNN